MRVHWLLLLLLPIAGTTALSKKAKPVACPGARYLLAGEASIISGAAVTHSEAIVVDDTRVAIEGGCAPAAAKITATRKGTRVNGRWRTCGPLRGVRVTAVVDPSCGRIVGTLRARKVRRPFAGSRSTCGDRAVDRGGGEDCEPPGSASCDAQCRSVAVTNASTPPTTSAPPTTTTTTIPKLAVWRPATVPFDPECRTGCTEVGRTAPLAHTQMQLIIRANPAIDDPIAQWGDCLESVLGCFERDGALAPCVEQAACPAQCKALFRSRAAAAVDENGRVDAFDAVFVDRAAPCRPADEDTP